MITISVKISKSLEDFINGIIKNGEAKNQTDVILCALRKYAENHVINQILISRQEIKEGKILRGNLKDLIHKYRKGNLK